MASSRRGEEPDHTNHEMITMASYSCTEPAPRERGTKNHTQRDVHKTITRLFMAATLQDSPEYIIRRARERGEWVPPPANMTLLEALGYVPLHRERAPTYAEDTSNAADADADWWLGRQIYHN